MRNKKKKIIFILNHSECELSMWLLEKVAFDSIKYASNPKSQGQRLNWL